MLMRKLQWFSLILFLAINATAQRVYKPASALSSGTWYTFSVKETGVYKIDIAFLSKLGVPTAGISSAAIRLYGNGGQMLSEANAGAWQDDLRENAIMIVDGGDGLLNGADYILFYANGPDEWVKDSANLRFTHRKNLFSDKSYYFLSIGGNGKRIINSPVRAISCVRTLTLMPPELLLTDNIVFSGVVWVGLAELAKIRSICSAMIPALAGSATTESTSAMVPCLASGMER